MYNNTPMAKKARGRGRGNLHSSPSDSSYTPPPPPPPPQISLPCSETGDYQSQGPGYDDQPMNDNTMHNEFYDESNGQGEMQNTSVAYKEEDANMVNVEDQASASDNCLSNQEGEKRFGRKFRGTRMKRKKKPGAKNLRIRKYAQPKNAVMCLNELVPGTTFSSDAEGGIGKPCCMSVEIDGQKYRGYGSSKQLAKQAAAEAALISFVKPPAANSGDEDKTPWATLTSFAMYKLFNDWREGRVGMCAAPAQFGAAMPPGAMLENFNAFFHEQSAPTAAGVNKKTPQVDTVMKAIKEHLGGHTSSVPSADCKIEPKTLPKPAKQVPEGASTMHPVMLLNQMKPGVKYNVNENTENGKPFFTITTEIDGQEFSGQGANVKKAKVAVAKVAIFGLFGVESTFES